MKKIIILLLFTSALFGEARYICLVEQVYDAYTLNTFEKNGIDSVDKMIFTLNNNVLIHHYKNYDQQDKQVKYLKSSTGTSTVCLNSGIKKVTYTEYRQNSLTPIIIYSFDNFSKIIRVNMEMIGTYSCTKF